MPKTVSTRKFSHEKNSFPAYKRKDTTCMASYLSSSHKNPSRKSCEQIIKKILDREFEEYGENHHFKQASDFMIYFESLHPASPSLTKQVQRAVNALNLPRDDKGYFMINKTAEEYQAERELSHLLQDSHIVNLDECIPVLIKMETWKCEHVMHLIKSIPGIQDLFETLTNAGNGILFYTKQPDELISCLSDYVQVDSQDTSEN